jgi:rhodanese-related sulfurtransferase
MLRKHVSLTLVAFLLCFTFGCPAMVDEFDILSAAGDTYFTNYTTPATGVSPNISIDDLLLLVNGDTPPYIIDCRKAEDYAAGHIKGAVNKTLGEVASGLADLPKDQLIVNVCYTGQTASFATAVINLAGLDPEYEGLEARNLLYGMCSVTTDTGFIPGTDKWASQIAEDEFADSLEQTPNTTSTTYEFPEIDTGETSLADIVAARAAEVASGWTIEAAEVFANADDYFIVNYWPEDQYLDPCHIPGSYQFTPKASLSTTADLDLLPTDQTIVVYCYTGQTSAQVVAYLRMLGYDAKSLLFGVNGFAYELNPGGKYTEPVNDYSSIIE